MWDLSVAFVCGNLPGLYSQSYLLVAGETRTISNLVTHFCSFVLSAIILTESIFTAGVVRQAGDNHHVHQINDVHGHTLSLKRGRGVMMIRKHSSGSLHDGCSQSFRREDSVVIMVLGVEVERAERSELLSCPPGQLGILSTRHQRER